MSWFNFCTENLQKRCCRYLLQRYVGRFLEHKIEPDQLSINVLDGAVSLEDIVLDVQALNDVGDEHQLPFEFVEGSVDKISLSVPWRNMLKESSIIHVEGLSLTVRPNVKETEGIPSSMLESVWSSMSNSVYSSPDSDYEESFDNAPESEQVSGLEVFTQAIESILNRIKVKFSNTVIKIEYMPDSLKLGLGLQLHIVNLDYIDEVADESKEGILYDSLAFLTKKLVIEGVFLQTYEFKCPKSNNEESISKINIMEPLTIAELFGTQTIRMVLKHNPSLPGPKLSLEINFGSLNVICSPRQLYLVIEILRGISKPLIEKEQNTPVQKPMSESDFNHIELDLFNHVEPRHDIGLRGMQGWSNLQDDEEEFFPLQGAKNKTFVPSMNSSMTSSMSSVASSKSDLSSRYTRHKNKGKHEWLGETNHFNIQLTSLCVVLLHEDILAVCPETDVITQCSLNEMHKISHQYFIAVQHFDIIKDCDKITNSLERNHLKFVTTNVTIEGDEKTNETVKDVNITASGGNVVIMEVLFETMDESTQYIPILKFIRDTKCSSPKMSNTSSYQPDIQIQFKHNTKSTRYCNPVSSEIKISMQEAFSEVDISIINRLSSYIYNPDFQISKRSQLNVCQPHFNEVIESVNETNMSCTLNFNYLVIKFRFPVPDLRPLSDINRLPWWKRILRDDILWLYLTDAEGSFTKTSQQTTATAYEVQCRSIEALFQEGNTNNIIPIAKCKGIDDDLKTIRMDAKLRPKLILKLCPVVGNQDEVKVRNPNIEPNMTSSVYVESLKNPSPFASKKIMRQRNHHSDGNEHEHNLGDGEIQVVPGSREEIMEFVENTNANAKVFLDITVPNLFVTLPSKHLYEIIYNRFTNDLFFWSPSFPTPTSRGDDTMRLSNILDRTRYFAPCKSGIQFDSESESEEEASNVYYSCKQSSLNIADPMIKRTEFCLNLNVTQGLFTMITQSRDRSGRVIPQHYGELQIEFDNLYLYLAAGYENTPRHNFICIQANKFCLSHENLFTNGGNIMTPKEVVCRKNKSLKRVLYKIPDGMDFKERTSSDKSDMLTVVVEISVCNHIKTIKVANEIYGTTLRHIFSVVSQSWYYQLSDFFDVIDYPVAGYESPHVITELHQHITDCLIDYRPLNLPYQCALTIGSFSLSSNLVARSKASTLQIVSEDVAFFISARLSKAENFDLISNYICVMDLGVFELSLKLSKSSKQSNTLLQPEVDLRMGINVIHIRTCADSAFALCHLISYLASDGDKSSVEEQTTEFEGVDQDEPVLLDHAESDNNSLSSLIMEAMHEETTGAQKSKNSVCAVKKPKSNNSTSVSQSGKGIEVFYFPDETNKIVTPLDIQSQLQFDIEDDDEAIEKEFCFVEHEAGSGLMPRSNIPEVRMLSDTQIRLINNYFNAPVGKIDVLQAPKEYPIPVVRYTLREMTLIWHMYGGTDFGTKTLHNELTKHVTIVSETNSCPTSPNILRPSSLSRYYSQTNINSQKNPTSNKGSAKISQARTRFCCSVLPTSWQAKGGPDREHHILMQLQLNKVRFQHEVYPLHTKQAMRQVILIQDFEIRDKLASSNINKFLYLYSSEAMPKQHDANMLVAKAVHTRPDSNLKAQECCIKVSMLPLRLNIDQDSLIFLISFVNQFNALSQKTKDEILNEKKIPLKSEEPIMTLGNACDGQQDIIPNPLIQLNDEFDEHFGQKNIPVISKPDAGTIPSDNKAPIYIRQFVFSPDVTIRLDYEGRHVDFSQGSLAGLLMGLAQLNCSEITLKRIVHKHGLLGFDKLLTYVTQEWLQDIKKHQLPSLLGGVGPMYSFVRLIQGFRDLVQLPIEQYQKDGRIVRGLQRGANSFTTSTAIAALEIATRIVNLIQRVAETTYDMVNPGPSMRQLRLKESRKKNRSNKRSHPADIREGVTTALTLVKEGLGETAQTIVRVASEEHEIKGTAGMVGGVMRQIPPTALTPIILASQATCNVLQGVRCQLAPDARVEAMQKWRCD